MCCLFGIIDYRHTLTARQKNRLLHALATAAEARGTDATGIAYNSRGRLRIYKRPLPGHRMRFCMPEEAGTVIGHTRMTTQGSARKNDNNHPFLGVTQNGDFALTHNGVLYNDDHLRRSLSLPKTRIETDSYIAVQLIERKKALGFDSLRYMAEQVEGSFTFALLDRRDNAYFVKGDNPLCLYHFPARGLYLYASTEEILQRALRKAPMPLKQPVPVKLVCGEILRIDSAGKSARSRFDDSNLTIGWYGSMWGHGLYGGQHKQGTAVDTYLEEVKSVASAFGYSPEAIDRLVALGFSAEELEDFLYTGEL